jgi:hypothetical protein
MVCGRFYIFRCLALRKKNIFIFLAVNASLTPLAYVIRANLVKVFFLRISQG